jgi:hypothetical protein
MYSEVTEILEDKNKLDKLQDIPKKLLKELIEFMQIFQQTADSLEQIKQPSMHKAVYWQHTLRHHLKTAISLSGPSHQSHGSLNRPHFLQLFHPRFVHNRQLLGQDRWVLGPYLSGLAQIAQACNPSTLLSSEFVVGEAQLPCQGANSSAHEHDKECQQSK